MPEKLLQMIDVSIQNKTQDNPFDACIKQLSNILSLSSNAY